jgi:hypothetical protein
MEISKYTKNHIFQPLKALNSLKKFGVLSVFCGYFFLSLFFVSFVEKGSKSSTFVSFVFKLGFWVLDFKKVINYNLESVLRGKWGGRGVTFDFGLWTFDGVSIMSLILLPTTPNFYKPDRYHIFAIKKILVYQAYTGGYKQRL